jgi:hypothetical protein
MEEDFLFPPNLHKLTLIAPPSMRDYLHSSASALLDIEHMVE